MAFTKYFKIIFFIVFAFKPIPLMAFDPKTDIKFLLYRTADQSTGELIKAFDSASLDASNFDETLETRFIIHGWFGSFFKDINEIIREAYFQLTNQQFNIIYVDWSSGAKNLNYYAARHLVPVVGNAVGNFTIWLKLERHISFNSIYFIGHSLGAHVAGYAGKTLNLAGFKNGVIYGLDPAREGFDFDNTATVLWRTDARHVEVIHTDTGPLGFGAPNVLGHADFYPNFGKDQPDCTISTQLFCSHSRAVDYFAESIYSTVGYYGNKCESYEEIDDEIICIGELAKMGGEPATTTNFGIFYVPINFELPPFEEVITR